MDAYNTARGARFLLGFSMYLILAQTDQVYLIFCIFPSFKPKGSDRKADWHKPRSARGRKEGYFE